MIIDGLNIPSGSEVIVSSEDYPFALNAWKNKAARESLDLIQINMDLPSGDSEILDAYLKNITPKTRAIHITHMTHRQGHIMPVEKLVQAVKEKNIAVVVDGAHCIAQIDVDLGALGCAFYASSLHKWLNAPHGTGFLFVREDKIGQLYNHPSSNLDKKDSIEKFEHIGTRAFHQEIGIKAALDFHELIGAERKTERLHAMKTMWFDQVSSTPKCSMHTDPSREKSCAVATFSIKGIGGSKIVNLLDTEFDIHAKSVGGHWGSGVRISTNLFTSEEDIKRLVHAIEHIAKRA